MKIREMLNEGGLGCVADGPFVQVGIDAYQLISYMRTGFDLAQPGGWQHVAPMWLRESRKASRDE